MADMTASGWYPSNVQVIKSWRPWGPRAHRHALVKMQLEATNFAGGAAVYPGEGIPMPDAGTVGFRESVDYVIPVGGFTHATKAGRFLSWACIPPTQGVSGAVAVSNVCRMKVQGLEGSGGVTYLLEAVSTLAASTLFTTDTMVGYGIFVGK